MFVTCTSRGVHSYLRRSFSFQRHVECFSGREGTAGNITFLRRAIIYFHSVFMCGCVEEEWRVFLNMFRAFGGTMESFPSFYKNEFVRS